ncbi:MAG: MFS transporter [Pseudomonadota bacterium]
MVDRAPFVPAGRASVAENAKPGRLICAERARPWLLAAAILASALGFIDGTVVSIAMPAIRGSLEASLGEAQWIANAYMLSLSALILLGGVLADRFGLVRVFASGIVLFIVTSLICAVVTGSDAMIVARFFQGIGAALMVPGSLALISRSYPPETRGLAIGIWAAASAVTTALGPLIGGLLLSVGGPEAWRWLFAVNLPLGALALWILHRYAQKETARMNAPLDLPGALLATLALACLALAFSEGGGLGWPVAIAGLALFASFLYVEHRSAHPMMPLHLFRDPAYSAANGLTFFLYFSLSAVLFYLPMTVIIAWALPTWAASLALLPLTLAITVMSGPVGALGDRFGPGWPILVGSLIVSLAYLWLGAAVAQKAYWMGVLPALTAMGVGMGFVVAPLSIAVMAAVPSESSGLASGTNNAIARMAGLLGVAMMGLLVEERYFAFGGTASFGAPDIAAASHAHAMTFATRDMCYAVALVSFCAAFAALWLPRRARALRA